MKWGGPEVAAYTCGGFEVSEVDLLLLQHVFWDRDAETGCRWLPFFFWPKNYEFQEFRKFLGSCTVDSEKPLELITTSMKMSSVLGLD